MKSLLTLAFAWAVLLFAFPASASDHPTPQEQARIQQIQEILDGLHPVTGDVPLPQAEAVLHLGKDYYFLPPEEARRVLVEGWGNPPATAEGVLGMVFPAGKTFVDDTWAAVITYDAMGFVSDSDAQTADYDAILEDLRSDEDAINSRRQEQGYPAQHLVGWAQQPVYDAKAHSVVWAQNIAFAGSEQNTLNYDVRLLGRRGVLSLNMVDTMPRLAETRAAAETFARAAEFNIGARYADYQEGIDREAEVGIAGLVAAGVGAAAAKKAGLLAVILAFGKKFIFLILAAVAALGGWLRKFLGRKDEDYAYDPADYAAEEVAAPDPHKDEPGTV